MYATKRDLIGRRIVAVDFRRFHCEAKSCTCASGPGRSSWHSDPVLTLDNGRRLFFVTDETEVGEYGTNICISERPALNGTDNNGIPEAPATGKAGE